MLNPKSKSSKWWMKAMGERKSLVWIPASTQYSVRLPLKSLSQGCQDGEDPRGSNENLGRLTGCSCSTILRAAQRCLRHLIACAFQVPKSVVVELSEEVKPPRLPSNPGGQARPVHSLSLGIIHV